MQMIKTNYENKIILGDTLTILKTLPNNFIDMGITSPPYNKGENKKGWLVKNIKYDNAIDKLPEQEYQKQQINVLNELYRVIKQGGSFFYNHKIRWEKGELFHPMDWLRKTNWTIRQEIIWDRKIAANIRGWRFWQTEERIYWLYKPFEKGTKIGKELKSKHALLSSIWSFSPENNNPHPAPFPICLPIRAIYSIMDEEKAIIIDPYCGSGTTLVAAKILGHNYLGIDISKQYIDFSKKRLNNYQNELSITNNEIKKHKVNKTFKERKEKGNFTGKFRTKQNLTKEKNLFEI
ncbi:MAG: site-specific DNA-methyltransferase [Candidatus Aenigmarchaeota archaeon ex4484_52]|nr:MAG: site-specific DNA-methyltransferase [Candidatus Aenigmarchaeota archaeon ex4484_52]